MARGLLLGNGINACIGIEDLSIKDIGQRFLYKVEEYSPIIENLFGVKINEDFRKYIDDKYMICGIETLAGLLYKYIKSNANVKWTDNDEYRIQDVISCVCLSSIFYLKDGKISGGYDKAKLPPIDRYDYIFTLNYVEFWDMEKKSIYLHGRVDFSKLDNIKNAVLVSKERMELKEYAMAVENMKKFNSVIEFYPNEVIFAPDGIEKKRLTCVVGVFPSDKLYPADDLFFYREKELYTELDKADELDIFGMSPYGDESIIDAINSKNSVRIFIYDKVRNKETYDWDKKLNCPHELLDSMEIYRK